MRHHDGPPAVFYPLGAGFAARGLWVLWLAGMAACAGGLLYSIRPPLWNMGLVSVALVGSAWFLYRFAHTQPTGGALLWTGSHWILRVTQDTVLREVVVCMDLQSMLLLRCTDEVGGRARWLLMRRLRAACADWHLLRCALYARRPTAKPAY